MNIKLSKIIDLCGIKKELEGLKLEDETTLGFQLFGLIASNLHKAENEILDVIATYKKINIKEVEQMDVEEVLATLKEMFSFVSLKKIVDFKKKKSK
jgi:hypothetical protein